ncbi:MAG: hypothetical protein NTY38_29350, partial [Acidobacteria bacterium]|nr:hypothetical protein [Acidobacteriota bacterium]
MRGYNWGIRPGTLAKPLLILLLLGAVLSLQAFPHEHALAHGCAVCAASPQLRLQPAATLLVAPGWTLEWL